MCCHTELFKTLDIPVPQADIWGAFSSTVPFLCALRMWNPSLYIGSILESHEHRVAILPKRIKHLD